MTGAQGTVGRFYDEAGDALCWLLELPDRGNKPNRSRIPAGEYAVEHLPRSGSGRYRDVYLIRSVPNRSGILIHPGNWAGDVDQGLRTDSWGCPLTALRLGRLAGQLAGLASRAAMARLHGYTERRDFLLVIRE